MYLKRWQKLIASATVFRCSVSHNKQATYRAFNAIFGKFGPEASAEAMIQYSKSILYYGIDVCPLTNTQINSLQFVINSCYTKIFMIKFSDDIWYCRDVLVVYLLLTLLKGEQRNFWRNTRIWHAPAKHVNRMDARAHTSTLAECAPRFMTPRSQGFVGQSSPNLAHV